MVAKYALVAHVYIIARAIVRLTCGLDYIIMGLLCSNIIGLLHVVFGIHPLLDYYGDFSTCIAVIISLKIRECEYSVYVVLVEKILTTDVVCTLIGAALFTIMLTWLIGKPYRKMYDESYGGW